MSHECAWHLQQNVFEVVPGIGELLWPRLFQRSDAVSKGIPTKSKQPETNGCSKMAIEILYIRNSCLGKHPFLSGCLGFPAVVESNFQPHVLSPEADRVHISQMFLVGLIAR